MENTTKKIQFLSDKLLDMRDLTFEEARFFLDEVAKGEVSDILITSVLVALQRKKPILQEILGFAVALRKHAVSFDLESLADEKKWKYPFIDTCGTGGDNKHTFNVSTLSAFVVAGCGVPVVKHGNSSVSSSCGSADLLKALGVPVDTWSPEQARACLIACDMTFLFAPLYHPAMKRVALVRKELGIRTIFNFLGPLLHPAQIECQFVGVFSPEVQRPMAEALQELGVKNFMVVHSEDGMDEVSIFEKSHILESFKGKSLSKKEIDPRDLHFFYSEEVRQKVQATSVEESVALAKDVLIEKKKGPARSMVLWNAACSLMIVGAAKGLEQGINMAGESIDQGKAKGVLDRMIKFSSSQAVPLKIV